MIPEKGQSNTSIRYIKHRLGEFEESLPCSNKSRTIHNAGFNNDSVETDSKPFEGEAACV
jgi:hypothetical protein